MRKFTEQDVSNLLHGFVPSQPGEDATQLASGSGEVRDAREFSEVQAEPAELSANEQVLVRRALAKFEFNKERPEDADRITLHSVGRLYAPVRFSRVSFRISYTIEVGHDIERQRVENDGTIKTYTETVWQTLSGQAADTVEFWIVASYEKALAAYQRIAYFNSKVKPDPAKKGYVYPQIGEVEYSQRVHEEMRHELYRYVVFRLYKNQKTRAFTWAGPIEVVETSPEYVMLLKVEYDIDGKRRRDAFIDERNYRNVVGKNRRGCFGVLLLGLVSLAATGVYALTNFV